MNTLRALLLAGCAAFALPAHAANLRPTKRVQIPARYRDGDKLMVKPAKVTAAQKIESLERFADRALGSMPAAFARTVKAKLAAPHAWRDVAAKTDLSGLSNEELGALGRALLDTPSVQRVVPGEMKGLATQFDRLLSAHGSDPADRLSVLSNMGISESNADQFHTLGLDEKIKDVFANARAAIEGKGLGPDYGRFIAKLGVATDKGTFTTYPDGPTAFTRIFDLMETAVEAKQAGRKAFIFNTTFSLKPDYIGKQYGAMLRRFARAGGPSYSIFEPEGSTALVDGTPIDNRLDLGPDKTLATRADGSHYLPKGVKDERSFYTRIVEPKGVSETHVNLTTTAASPLADQLSHRKATIVGFENPDGKMEIHVVNGDLNDSDEHILWRGFAHEITGPAVADSVKDMLELWKASSKTEIPDDVRKLMETPQPEAPGMVPVGTIAHRGESDRNIKTFLLSMIEAMPGSGHFIAAAPYNSDPDEFRELAEAAKRVAAAQKAQGIEGHAPILLMPLHNDQATIADAFQAAIPDLVKNGVEVRYYDGAAYLNGFSHSKRGAMYYRDPNDRDAEGTPKLKGIAYNGTSNWDYRSTKNNWEEDQVVQDPKSVAAVAHSLALDISESKKVGLDAAGKIVVTGEEIGEKQRLADSFAADFRGLL